MVWSTTQLFTRSHRTGFDGDRAEVADDVAFVKPAVLMITNINIKGLLLLVGADVDVETLLVQKDVQREWQ